MIRPALLTYVRFPLSLRNVEDLPFERGMGPARDLAVTGALSLGGNSTVPPLSAFVLWAEATAPN